jgi:hypothetical protein
MLCRYPKLLWSKTDIRAVTSVHSPPYASGIVVSANMAGEVRVHDAKDGRSLRTFLARHYRHEHTLPSHEKNRGSLTGVNGVKAVGSSKDNVRASISREPPLVGSKRPWDLASTLLDPIQVDKTLNKRDGGGIEQSGPGGGVPILSVWAGMTKIVAAHTDHTLALCKLEPHARR